MKKTLALFLVAVMLLSLVPAGAITVDQEPSQRSVESISISDIVLVENNTCYTMENPDGSEYTYYYYNPTVTVTFTDQTVVESISSNILIDGEWQSVEFTDLQETEHWVKDNTYTVTASLQGVSTTFRVSIIESPIANVYFSDVTLLNESDGCWETDIDGQEFFYYSIPYPNVTVLLKNGDVMNFPNGNVEIDGISYSFSYRDNQYSEHWTLGNTYQVPASLGGCTGVMSVTIIDSPITDIHIDDFSITPGQNCSLTTDRENGGFYLRYFIYPQVTLTLADGSTTTTDRGCFDYQGKTYFITIDDNQENNHWMPGNTYEITAGVENVTTSFHVTVDSLPVRHVEFEDVILYANLDGHKQTDMNMSDYFYYNFHPMCTITYNDGSQQRVSTNDVRVNGEPFDFYCYDNQYEEHWTVGNTYEVPVSILGFMDTIRCTVKESPVVSVSARDVEFLANTNGYTSYDESGNEYYKYQYSYNTEYTVTFEDGTVITNHGPDFSYEGHTFRISVTDNQDTDHWLPGRTYSVNLEIGDISGTFNVSITESPISEIIFDPIQLYENSNGYFQNDFMTGGYFYHYSYYPSSFTVKLKDGTVLESNGSGIYYNDQYYHLAYTDTQWQEHWTVGNEYKVAASILGFSTEFTVSIEEAPIKNIAMQNTSVIAGTHLSNSYYSFEAPPLTVTLKDNQMVTVNPYKSYSGNDLECYECYIDDIAYTLSINAKEMQQDKPWEEGNTYTVTASIASVSTTFDVSIVKNPVVEVIVEDVYLYENTGGIDVEDENGRFFLYDKHLQPTEYSFKLADGTILKAEEFMDYSYNNPYYVVIDHQFYELTDVTDEQDINHWNVGVHSATASFLDVTCDFNVTILENPIVDVKVDDCAYICSHHQIPDPMATVTYADGTVVRKKISLLPITAYYDPIFNQSQTHYTGDSFVLPLYNCETAGRYEFTITVNSKTYPVNVTVTNELSIKTCKLIKPPTKTAYASGQFADPTGAVIRVTFSDDTYEDLTVAAENTIGYYALLYSNSLRCSLWLNCYFIGDEMSMDMEGISDFARIPVTIGAPKTDSIVIKTLDEKNFIITSINDDGTTEDFRFLGFESFSGISSPIEVKEVTGVMRTDKGFYSASIRFSPTTLQVVLEISGKAYESNIITNADSYRCLRPYSFVDHRLVQLPSVVENMNNYNGTVTKENIDILVYLALSSQGAHNFNNNEAVFYFSANDVKTAVCEYLKLDSIDLSLSKLYDAETDMYRLDNRYCSNLGAYYFSLGTEYSNGTYIAKFVDYDGRTVITVKFDDDMRLMSYSTRPIISATSQPGDCDGSGDIDTVDLVMLKKYLAGLIDKSDIAEGADFDRNGNIDTQDLVSLKKQLAGLL